MSAADATVWSDALSLARRACREFKLPMIRHLEPMTYHPIIRRDGEADKRQRLIRLRPWRLGRPKQPLSRATIMACLAHELAHFAGPLDGLGHDEEHGDLVRAIAKWLRGQGQPVAHRIHCVSHDVGRRRRVGRVAWRNGRQRIARAAKR